ncbi:DUF2249 domain-containing protein [Nakamurella lactea]|uniref:DUF2249 domain-containing protein n=1 Tax=Nakamurella lactea TaxID=459515 RepID=UPI000414F3B5|nr:DUF2249 domain-containing protein [Nakamurella lactea]
MDVLIASNERDARAASAVVDHHAEMAGALAAKVEALLAAAGRVDAGPAQDARDDLALWCAADLVPHALAEEAAMYPAAQATVEGRLLIQGMLAEHQAIVDLVREIERSTEAVRAAAAGRALKVLFDVHLAKENELVIPLLVGTPGVSIGDILDGMHDAMNARDGSADGTTDSAAVAGDGAAGHGGSCACGAADEPGFPELDVQTIPHAIRHATIFGALDAVREGGGLIIAANHDPVPLLGQLQQRSPGAFQIDYLERGPQTWKIQFVRATTAVG